MTVFSEYFPVVRFFYMRQFNPGYPVFTEVDGVVSFCVTHLQVVPFSTLVMLPRIVCTWRVRVLDDTRFN